MKLAIDSQTAHIYIGVGSAEFTLPYGTSVTQATLMTPETAPSDLPSGQQPNMTSWVFHEQSFDPASRLRRGSLYQPEVWKSWPSQQAVVHPPKELIPGSTKVGEFRIGRDAYCYEPCRKLLQMPRGGVGSTLALGTTESASLWRVVDAEVAVGGSVVVTLKSRGYLGSLPDIALGGIDKDFQGDVSRALDRAADAAHRESPASVVDQCRNALTVALSRWLDQESRAAGKPLQAQNKDLGDLAKLVPTDRECIFAVARLIAKLHSRGKDNERAKYKTRTPDENDADLAVQSLGFALREFGWASADPV